MSKSPVIPEDRLRFCLEEQYGLSNAEFLFLPLGLDYRSAVYRVISEQGTDCLLKVTSRPLYEPRYTVPRYLYDQGIASVVAPVFTRNGTLWTRIGDQTAVVFPFVNGESDFHGMMPEQWMKLGAVMRRIHQMTLPPDASGRMRREIFDPADYIRWVQRFEEQSIRSEPEANGSVHFAQCGRSTGRRSARC
jgi:spectinomycin phosphotransferase